MRLIFSKHSNQP